MSKSDAIPSSMGERGTGRPFERVHYTYAGLVYEVMDELGRAHAKFPRQTLPWGGHPNRVLLGLAGPLAHVREDFRAVVDAALRHGTADWLMVICEEFLEAGAESDWPKARAELIQIAAMCLRAIADRDARESDPINTAVRAEEVYEADRLDPRRDITHFPPLRDSRGVEIPKELQ